MDQDLQAIFRDKPEMVIDLPEWMLQPEVAQEIGGKSGAAIVELAGRDSVAAAVAVARSEKGLSDVLPTFAYTGTEHGHWANVAEALHRLREALPADVWVHPLVVLGSPGLWSALCGRYLRELQARLGFPPICPGCHLYFHALRIPLARRLGVERIIAGERESHDGKVKINQVADALEFYQGLCASFGLHLELPLAKVADGEQVRRLTSVDWPEGGDQVSCALSGNYRAADGEVEYDPAALRAFFQNFAVPVAEAAVHAYLEDRVPDHLGMAREQLARWGQ